MGEKTNSHSEVKKKQIAVLIIIGAFLLLFVVLSVVFTLRSKFSGQNQKKEEYAEIFKVYEQYGLVYDSKTNRLYYNSELVRYFEDVINEDHYKEWPNQDGEIDVHAVRNASGGLVGVEAFDEQAFMDRTPVLEEVICELQITESINGYTGEVKEQVKDRMEAAYVIYQPYGLTYDRESDRLYYEGELVGYFEDQELKHFFGPYDDSTIVIYAARDKKGKLTGLDIVSEQ